MFPAIAIENVTKEAAVKIGRTVNPIKDRRPDTHVDLHHDRVIMMGSMVSAGSIDDGAIHEEPVVLDMAAEMNELVPHIAANHARHHQPAGVR